MEGTSTNSAQGTSQNDQRTLLARWHERILLEQRAHYEAALIFDRRRLRIGVPTVALSALVGTSAFASLGDGVVGGAWGVFAVGLAGVAAAVLAALQTFLGYSEQAAAHRTTRKQYGKVKRKIEAALATDRGASMSKALADIEEATDKADEASPNVPDRAWRKAKKGIEADDPRRRFVQTIVDLLEDPETAGVAEEGRATLGEVVHGLLEDDRTALDELERRPSERTRRLLGL